MSYDEVNHQLKRTWSIIIIKFSNFFLGKSVWSWWLHRRLLSHVRFYCIPNNSIMHSLYVYIFFRPRPFIFFTFSTQFIHPFFPLFLVTYSSSSLSPYSFRYLHIHLFALFPEQYVLTSLSTFLNSWSWLNSTLNFCWVLVAFVSPFIKQISSGKKKIHCPPQIDPTEASAIYLLPAFFSVTVRISYQD